MVSTADSEFERLVKRCSKVMARAVRSIGRQRRSDPVPDAEQAINTALWERLHGEKGIERSVSFVYRAALTTALDVMRGHPSPPTSADCPDDDRLASLAIDDGSDDARTEPTGHVDACRRCSAIVHDLTALDRAADDSGADAIDALSPIARQDAAPRGFRLLVVAAAVIVIAVGGWLIVRNRRDGGVTPGSGDSTMRGTAPGTVAVEPQDGQVVAEAPVRLRWRTVPGAEAYRATILDSAAVRIWQSPWTEATEVDVPAEVRRTVRHRAVYYWRLEARAGVETWRLPLYAFSVEP